MNIIKYMICFFIIFTINETLAFFSLSFIEWSTSPGTWQPAHRMALSIISIINLILSSGMGLAFACSKKEEAQDDD